LAGRVRCDSELSIGAVEKELVGRAEQEDASEIGKRLARGAREIPGHTIGEIKVQTGWGAGPDIHVCQYTYGNRRHAGDGPGPNGLRPKLVPCRRTQGDVLRLNKLRLVQRNSIAVVAEGNAKGVQLWRNDVAGSARRLVPASEHGQGGHRRSQPQQ